MKLFDVADRYCKESSWKTLALLKFCLFSIGLMVGMQVPKEKRKAVYGDIYSADGEVFPPVDEKMGGDL